MGGREFPPSRPSSPGTSHRSPGQRGFSRCDRSSCKGSPRQGPNYIKSRRRDHGSAPILMDYGIVDAHDVTCFSAGGFEEGYLQDNFYKGRIHFVQDSDELGMLSLTPRSVARAKPV